MFSGAVICFKILKNEALICNLLFIWFLFFWGGGGGYGVQGIQRIIVTVKRESRIFISGGLLESLLEPSYFWK